MLLQNQAYIRQIRLDDPKAEQPSYPSYFLSSKTYPTWASAETRQAKCFKDAKARAAEVAGGKRHRMSNLYITLEIDGTKSLSMYAYMRGCQ